MVIDSTQQISAATALIFLTIVKRGGRGKETGLEGRREGGVVFLTMTLK